MLVWLQNPFDNLPSEGYRKMRYALLATALAAKGDEVVWWASDFSHARKSRRRLVRPSAESSFASVRLVPTVPYSRNVSIRRVWSHLRHARTWERMALAERRRPDLIVTSFPTISAAAAAIRLGRRLGAKVVVDVQDAWPETFERILPRAVLSPLRFKAHRIFRSADLVTGVCDRYRDLVGRVDYYRAYLGIESGEPPVDRRPAGGRFRLAYVGGTGRSYDLATVRAAVERLGAELVIAGGSNYLGDGELKAMLETCDAGVVPMTDDSWVGIPNKIFDYARAGLPIVSSLGGESSELLIRAGCGVDYRAGDVDSLVAALSAVRDLPRGESRRLCEREFDARKIYSDFASRLHEFRFND